MKRILLPVILLFSLAANSQELFTMTDPASNIAAKSISIRIDQSIMDEKNSSKTNYHLIPEVAVGVSKKWMVRGSAFLSNRTDKLQYEGASIYAKYRFLSTDALQQHFRLASFFVASYNTSDIHQEEINLNGHNTGFEAGIIATRLKRKLAVSSSVSLTRAFDNGDRNKFIYGRDKSNAINYSLSFGRLMLPRAYKSYRQTNFNIMIETMAQYNPGSGKYFIDIAPSIQFIVLSQSRIDISYRKEIYSSLLRTAPNGFLVRLEHNLFNAF